MVAVRYAYEKFMVAVETLCKGTGTLQQRLGYAAVGGLIRLKLDDVPAGEIRDALSFILKGLTRRDPVGDVGSITATVAVMDDLEAEKLARLIFETFLKLRDIDPLEGVGS